MDKEKSIIDKLVDTISNAVGNIAKSAVSPTVDAECAETANQQMYVPDAAAMPVTYTYPKPRQFSAKKPAVKTKSKNKVAKKAGKKPASARRPAKKTAKKVAKKKKAKRD